MLFREVKADEIECRISQVNQYGVGLLLYKDARCDQNILDETVGEFDWQRKHEVIDGRLYCSVGLYDHNKEEWVWKQDVGTESYTEKEKGQASDSFKRACFNWGIGRELYTAPNMFVYKQDLKTFEDKNGKYTCKDYFTVTKLEYSEKRRISLVEIRNEKTGGFLTFGVPKKEAENTKKIGSKKITKTKAEVLKKACEDFADMGLLPEKVLSHFGVESFDQMTEQNFVDAMAMIRIYEQKRAKDNGV